MKRLQCTGYQLIGLGWHFHLHELDDCDVASQGPPTATTSQILPYEAGKAPPFGSGTPGPMHVEERDTQCEPARALLMPRFYLILLRGIFGPALLRVEAAYCPELPAKIYHLEKKSRPLRDMVTIQWPR